MIKMCLKLRWLLEIDNVASECQLNSMTDVAWICRIVVTAAD